MAIDFATALASLDVGTLFVIAICVTVVARPVPAVRLVAGTASLALAWWGFAYLIGGASGVRCGAYGDLFSFRRLPCKRRRPSCCSWRLGMVWSAARLFHGRPDPAGARHVASAPRSGWPSGSSCPAFVTGSADVAAWS
jgi:hypothetical protein